MSWSYSTKAIQYPKEVEEFIESNCSLAHSHNKQLEKIKEDIAKQEAIAKAAWDLARKMKTHLQTQCLHPNKNVVDTHYAESSYTKYTVKCEDCDALLFTTTKHHYKFG